MNFDLHCIQKINKNNIIFLLKYHLTQTNLVRMKSGLQGFDYDCIGGLYPVLNQTNSLFYRSYTHAIWMSRYLLHPAPFEP